MTVIAINGVRIELDADLMLSTNLDYTSDAAVLAVQQFAQMVGVDVVALFAAVLEE